MEARRNIWAAGDPAALNSGGACHQPAPTLSRRGGEGILMNHADDVAEIPPAAAVLGSTNWRDVRSVIERLAQCARNRWTAMLLLSIRAYAAEMTSDRAWGIALRMTRSGIGNGPIDGG